MSESLPSTAYALVLSGVQMSAGKLTFSIRDASTPAGQLAGTATIRHTRGSGDDILQVTWPDKPGAGNEVAAVAAERTVAQLDRFAFFEWLRLAKHDVHFVGGETTWLWRSSELWLVVAGREYVFPADAIGTLRVLAGR